MAKRDPLNTLGASNHSKKERSERDYYGTDPRATKAILNRETFNKNVWEPCAGRHKMSQVLEAAGYNVRKSDIFDYGYNNEILDFLDSTEHWDGDIITNPPYELATEFVVKSLATVNEGNKVAMFLRTLFLESQSRYTKIFKDNPPKIIYIFSKRQVCSKVDDFTEGSAVSYCWMIWEKGFKGDPIVKWINEEVI